MGTIRLSLTESEAIWLCRLLGGLNCAGESTQPLERIYTKLANKVEPRLDGYAHNLPELRWELVEHGFHDNKVLIRFGGDYQ